MPKCCICFACLFAIAPQPTILNTIFSKKKNYYLVAFKIATTTAANPVIELAIPIVSAVVSFLPKFCDCIGTKISLPSSTFG